MSLSKMALNGDEGRTAELSRVCSPTGFYVRLTMMGADWNHPLARDFSIVDDSNVGELVNSVTLHLYPHSYKPGFGFGMSQVQSLCSHFCSELLTRKEWRDGFEMVDAAGQVIEEAVPAVDSGGFPVEISPLSVEEQREMDKATKEALEGNDLGADDAEPDETQEPDVGKITLTLPPCVPGTRVAVMNPGCGPLIIEMGGSTIAEPPKVDIESCSKCGGYMKCVAVSADVDPPAHLCIGCSHCGYQREFPAGMPTAECVYRYNRLARFIRAKIAKVEEYGSIETVRIATAYFHDKYAINDKGEPAAKPEAKPSAPIPEASPAEREEVRAEARKLMQEEQGTTTFKVSVDGPGEIQYPVTQDSKGVFFDASGKPLVFTPFAAKPLDEQTLEELEESIKNWNPSMVYAASNGGSAASHKMLIVGTPGDIEPCMDCGGAMAFGMRDVKGTAIHCISCQACPLEIHYPIDTPMSECFEHYNHTAKCKRAETPAEEELEKGEVRSKPCENCGCTRFVLFGHHHAFVRCAKCRYTTLTYTEAAPHGILDNPGDDITGKAVVHGDPCEKCGRELFLRLARFTHPAWGVFLRCLNCGRDVEPETPAKDQWPKPIRRDPKQCEACGGTEFDIPGPPIEMKTIDSIVHSIRCLKCGHTHTENISYDWSTLADPAPTIYGREVKPCLKCGSTEFRMATGWTAQNWERYTRCDRCEYPYGGMLPGANPLEEPRLHGISERVSLGVLLTVGAVVVAMAACGLLWLMLDITGQLKGAV